MDIVNILTLQLTEIQNNLKKDLLSKKLTYNYLVHGKEDFLSFFKLQSYILNNECKNTEPLKNINKKCVNIVELWNVDLKDIPNKFENDDEDAEIAFHAVATSKEFNYWQTFNTNYGKNLFLEEYDYSVISIPNIANKCISLGNLIENQFPEAHIGYSLKYYLNHYLTTKRFNLQSIIKPLEKRSFDSFCNRIDDYEFRYYYIFKNLNDKKQIEFKHDTLDHLKKVCDAQLLSKYKVVLNDLIEKITNYDGNEISKSAEIEENDIILSTIDDYFDNIREQINDADYEKLRNALKMYLEKGKFPTFKEKINLKKLSVKKVGWKINRVLYDFGKSVSIDVLHFAIENITIYSKYVIDNTDYTRTTIYKYFTQKT